MAVFDRLALGRRRRGGRRFMTEMGEPGLQAGRQQHAGAEQQKGGEKRQKGFHEMQAP